MRVNLTSVARWFHRHFDRHTILIHTPKCGGTYLRQAWAVGRRVDVSDVGHRTVRDLSGGRRTRIVGLIREPADWYASYYFFHRQSLAENPASISNFPPAHPISIFARNGAGVAQLMGAMRSFVLREASLEAETVAVVYGKEQPDALPFMSRTGTGFWTWTMMHHFSAGPTTQLRTCEDVVRAAHEIAARVAFIHLERMEADARGLLGPPSVVGSANASPRPAGHALDLAMRRCVAELDGDVARILGGYHLASGNTSETAPGVPKAPVRDVA